MSSAGLQRGWKALFFGAFRRQPTSKNYRYRYVAPKIKRLVLNTYSKELTRKDVDTIVTRCDRQLFTSSVEKIREVILQDINGSQHANIKVVRSGSSKRLAEDVSAIGVLSWQNIAPIFAHPLNPICVTEGTYSPFAFENTLRLESKDGSTKLSHVSWANLGYSNSCQGIGVTEDKFNELKDTEFVNPSNGGLLRVLLVDEVPEGCDGIGLFPAYDTSQRQFFTGLDLCAALIRQPRCTGKEHSNVATHLSSSSKLPEGTISAVQQPPFETEFQTLKQLIDATNRCRLLWSSAKDKDKTCPGDIIRCTLVSEKADFSQLLEECCKHYILFTLVSQAQRTCRSIGKLDSFQNKELKFSPIDCFVWREFLKVDQIPPPTSLTEMRQYKERIDTFLELLSSYYFSIVAEMKSSSRNYFHDNDNIPRAVTVLKMLYEIVKNCKGFHAFYPNLSLYAKRSLPEMPLINELNVPNVANDEAKVALGSKALSIFKHITEFEHIMFHDRLDTTHGLEIEPVASLKSWKIVILSKTSLPLEIERALVFNSRVYTECVTDLENATLIKHASCKERKMIDEDTFVFLYQLHRPPKVDKAQMASDIISKLEKVSQAHHL